MESITAASSIRKKGQRSLKDTERLHLLHMLRGNLMMSVSKSTRSWTTVPVCKSYSPPQQHCRGFSSSEDLLEHLKILGGVKGTHRHSVATIWRWVEDEVEEERASKSDFMNPLSFITTFWVKGELVAVCCSLYQGSVPSLLSILHLFGGLHTCGLRVQPWTEAEWMLLPDRGVCEAAIPFSLIWSPSCLAVGWAIAEEHSFHMWVCDCDANHNG